jgi:hypothetical protein
MQGCDREGGAVKDGRDEEEGRTAGFIQDGQT